MNKILTSIFKNNWLLFIILVLVILFLCSCEEKLKPSTINLKSYELPAQESWNNEIIFSDSGFTRAILKAGHILYYSEKAEYLLNEGVKVDFFNRIGNHTSVLTSDSAKIDDRTKNMIAFGNVKVVSDSGVVLTTEEMHWNNSTRRIFGDKFVTIVSPKETLQGYGFESDQNLKDYVIKKVSGQVTTKETSK